MVRMVPNGLFIHNIENSSMNYSYKLSKIIIAVILVLGFISCGEDTKKAEVATVASKPRVKIPAFDMDNAYANIEKQLSFGHRVPGTPEHAACKDWIVSELQKNGATVQVQEFKADFLGLKQQQSYNIIASYNLDKKPRIMLAAHWDSRLVAEKDKDESLQKKPIMGADDGGSGVGVLLEISRLFNENPIDLGVDIVFFDAEDNGVPNGDETTVDTWCLGSQYWAKNPHEKNYKAKYGILLDLVGAKGAEFLFEGYSANNAPDLLKKTWTLAQNMGYSNYFKNENAGYITDDHVHVMNGRNFPMIDIISLPNRDKSGFAAHHHTHDDDLAIIDKNTLRAVGQVVTALVYKESDGSF